MDLIEDKMTGSRLTIRYTKTKILQIFTILYDQELGLIHVRSVYE